MTSGYIGSPSGNILVPITNFTKRTKVISLTTANGTNFTRTDVQQASGIFYADSDGKWRLNFNISVTATMASAQSWRIAISNVVFKTNTNMNGQSVKVDVYDNAFLPATAIAESGTNTILFFTSAASYSGTKGVTFSGDIELNAEPTTYTTAANMEGVANVSAYFPNADASTTGLLSNAAQTIGGLKTLNDGLKFGGTVTAAAGASGTQTTMNWYEEGTWTPVYDCTGVGPGTVTYAAGRYGLYRRIGNVVFVAFYLEWTTMTGSPTGTFLISGLPFVCKNVGSLIPAGAVQTYKIVYPANMTMVTAQAQPNTNWFMLAGSGSNQIPVNVLASDNAGTVTRAVTGSLNYFV